MYKSINNINQGTKTSVISQISTVNEIQNSSKKSITKLTNKHIICYFTDLIEREEYFLINNSSKFLN